MSVHLNNGPERHHLKITIGPWVAVLIEHHCEHNAGWLQLGPEALLSAIMSDGLEQRAAIC